MLERDRLDGPVDPFGMVIFSPAGGISQADPVGGFVAGAGKPLLVYKGLQVINDVFLVFADRLGVAQIMVLSQQAVAQPFGLGAAHLFKAKGFKRRQLAFDRPLINGDLFGLPAPDQRIVRSYFPLWQPNVAGPVQGEHQ